MRRPATIFLAVLGVAAAALVMEIILQFTEANSYNSIINDPASGLLIYRPDTSFVHSGSCYENTVEVNSDGLHAPPAPAKGAGVFRIVVVGNSFVESVQVPVRSLFTTLLQNELNAQPSRHYTYEVIPIGFSGNGELLDTLYYLRFGQMLKPDLVIDLTTEKEIEADASATDPKPQFDAQEDLVVQFPKVSLNPSMTTLTNLMRRSQLLVNLHNRYLVLRENIREDLAQPLPVLPVASNAPAGQNPLGGADEGASWDLEGKLITAFSRIVARDHSRFLLASWVTSQAATSTAQTFAPHLASIAEATHVTYVDLAPAFSAEEKAAGISGTWSCDIHWNENGHRYTEQALFQYLQAHPALIGS